MFHQLKVLLARSGACLLDAEPGGGDSLESVTSMIRVNGDLVVSIKTRHGPFCLSAENLERYQRLYGDCSVRVVDAVQRPPPSERDLRTMRLRGEDVPRRHFAPSHGDCLAKILARRASEQGLAELAAALAEPRAPDALAGAAAANQWLARHGLERFRVVNYKDAAALAARPQATVVDDMRIRNLGYYAIWVRDVRVYARPEMDIDYGVSLADLCDLRHWGPVDLEEPRARAVPVVCFQTMVHGREPVAVATYPGGRAYFDSSCGKRVTEFLLECLAERFDAEDRRREEDGDDEPETGGAAAGGDTVILAGYHSSFFDAPLLRRRASDGRWVAAVGDDAGPTLIYRGRHRVLVRDLGLFNPSFSPDAFVRCWARAERGRLDDRYLRTRADLERYRDQILAYLSESCYYLHCAALAQSAALAEAFGRPDPLRCPSLFDAFYEHLIARAAQVPALAPTRCSHPDLADLLERAARRDGARVQVEGAYTAAERELDLRPAALRVLAREYPVGYPYCTAAPDLAGRLSLVRCRVEAKPQNRFPVLAADGGEGVYTSAEVEYAVRVLDCRVEVLEALEWPGRAPIFREALEAFAERVASPAGDRAAHEFLFREVVANDSGALLGAPFGCRRQRGPRLGHYAAFARGYARVAAHELMRRLDNEYCPRVVSSYTSSRVFVRPSCFGAASRKALEIHE
ncbi:IEV protein [Nile crocodilepox virus]|uniref:IEV protein n=1 Tax=Nile crocodilepox virus (isolate Crocodylus niloticus/Zimbabwe/Ume/2001) TaxID=1289473 RepID=Q070L3_CPRVZ|nr:IEV protein [Nile crocodilepox virus]ABJ08929.1 IEV protein [Nile crocodilepox virus]